MPLFIFYRVTNSRKTLIRIWEISNKKYRRREQILMILAEFWRNGCQRYRNRMNQWEKTPKDVKKDIYSYWRKVCVICKQSFQSFNVFTFLEAFGTTWSKHYCNYDKDTKIFSMLPYNQLTTKTVSLFDIQAQFHYIIHIRVP